MQESKTEVKKQISKPKPAIKSEKIRARFMGEAILRVLIAGKTHQFIPNSVYKVDAGLPGITRLINIGELKKI